MVVNVKVEGLPLTIMYRGHRYERLNSYDKVLARHFGDSTAWHDHRGEAEAVKKKIAAWKSWDKKRLIAIVAECNSPAPMHGGLGFGKYSATQTFIRAQDRRKPVYVVYIRVVTVTDSPRWAGGDTRLYDSKPRHPHGRGPHKRVQKYDNLSYHVRHGRGGEHLGAAYGGTDARPTRKNPRRRR